MRFVVAGGRNIKEITAYGELVKLRIVNGRTHPFAKATEIVCGKAMGPDMAGDVYGDFYGVPRKYFEPEYDKYGRYRAPKIRNNKMAVYGDALVLIWDGKSGGSRHMKEAMLALGKPVYEIILEADNVERKKS